MQRVFEHLIIIIIIIIIIVMCSKKCFFFFLVKKLSCAVDKRMDAKRKPHRAHSVTYAIWRNYKTKTKKNGDKR